jgi:hypothetical protein
MENSSEVSRSESAVQDEAINFKNLLEFPIFSLRKSIKFNFSAEKAAHAS